MRPPQPDEPAGEGKTWQPVPAGPDWRVQGDGRCRAGGGARGRKTCGRPAVMALNRPRYHRVFGQTAVWWPYCESDSAARYGRWVENGQVWHWKAVPAR